MRPTQSDVHVNGPLSNISTAYLQSNRAQYAALTVFQPVPVMHKTDLYYRWTKADWFKSRMEKRAPATPSAGGNFGLSTDSYNCEDYSLHYDLADPVLANADPQVDLDRAATEWLTQQALLKMELDWAAKFFLAGVWGTTKTGGVDFTQWSNYGASDPADDVEQAKVFVKRTTGLEPNTMTVNREVHAKLKFHPLIRDQFKYVSAESISAAMLARYFEVDRYVVCGATNNTAADGAPEAPAGADYSFIVPDGCLLTYTPPSPGLLTPAAGYTFHWTRLRPGSAMGGTIKRFRMEEIESDRLEISAAWAQKIVGADLGYFFTDVVA